MWLAPFRPNGKPLQVQGFLRAFDRAARRNADMLDALAQGGVPLVGLDPAMTLVYRQEYAKLPRMVRLPSVLLPQEWLLDALPAEAPPRAVPGDFRLLAHCTEKTNAPAAAALWPRVFARAGLRLEAQASGCCGMSGTYGHEQRNLQTSQRIFSQSWAPLLAGRARAGGVPRHRLFVPQPGRAAAGAATAPSGGGAGAAVWRRLRRGRRHSALNPVDERRYLVRRSIDRVPMSNARLPSFKFLIGFEAAARLGNYSRAAEELHVSQSAISHQIAQLEQQVGQPLFRRKGRGVELTVAGGLLLDSVGKSLEQIRHGLHRIETYMDDRLVTLVCPAPVAHGWLQPRIDRLLQAHPDLCLSLIHI